MSDWGRARSPLVQVGCQVPRITSQRENWPGHSCLICIWEIKSREAGSICWPGNESNATYTPAAFNGAITSRKLSLHLFEEGRHLCRKNLKDSTISCSKVLKWPKQRCSHETGHVQSRYKRGRKPFKHFKKKNPCSARNGGFETHNHPKKPIVCFNTATAGSPQWWLDFPDIELTGSVVLRPTERAH